MIDYILCDSNSTMSQISELQKNTRSLITRINETNIINLLKNDNIGHIYLDECLICHTISTF